MVLKFNSVTFQHLGTRVQLQIQVRGQMSEQFPQILAVQTSDTLGVFHILYTLGVFHILSQFPSWKTGEIT